MAISRAVASYSAAVDDLRAQLAAVPAGEPVRLAKRTSNLFRFSRAQRATGLDASALREVFSVDPQARTADVGGMATYEHIVDVTLAHGLMPLVVPQLKTITLGGAVAGLGIESTSFRNGLPHESVLEMDVLTSDGAVVTATPGNEHSDLFHGFPNSYGTLGYALRLRIELEPVRSAVALRHVRFGNAQDCVEAIADICALRSYQGEPVDFLDGTVFAPDAYYLTLGTHTDSPGRLSDYRGMGIYYRSIAEREHDALSTRDYLWRWDTDWFWCSKGLGAQHPMLRRVWPKRYLRSDVYRRIVALDRRLRLTDRLRELSGSAEQEPVIQDVEIPIGRLGEFLDFFHTEMSIVPIWLCPLRLRAARPWPLYPLVPGELYVNVGFWSSVPVRPGEALGARNRRIETVVSELGGHKSLYSTSYYREDEFWRLYNGTAYAELKRRYDPAGRQLGLYDKCVRGR